MLKNCTLFIIVVILLATMPSFVRAEAAEDACTVENSLFVASSLYGLNCLDNTNWHTYTRDTGSLPFSAPQDIAMCPDNTVLVLHALGLTAFDGENWNDLPKGDWFAPKTISCGADGQLWVGHMRGVSHYDGSAWTNYDLDQFGTDSRIIAVEDIVTGADGTVWALTARSASLFSDGAWQVYENGNGFTDDFWLRHMAVDNEGQPWIAHTTGLLHMDANGWQNIAQQTAQTIAIDSENRVWVGSSTEGVSVFDGGNWQTYNRENSGLNSLRVLSLAADGQGRIWVGTEWGLSVFDGENWQTYLMGNSGLVDNTISTLIVSGNGPVLPEPQDLQTGSVIGVIEYGRDPVPNTQVELCTESPGGVFQGATPCEDMAGSLLVSTDADGNFVFEDIPIGRYGLAVESPDGWIHFIGANSTIEVLDGMEVDLADIEVGE